MSEQGAEVPYEGLQLAELVPLVAAGDPRAWHTLHERYSGWMRQAIHRRLGRSSRRRFDTDDVVQSTFVDALQGFGSFEFRGEASFKAWLKKILVGTYVNMLQRESARGHDGSPTDRLDGFPEPPDGSSDRPSEILSRLEMQQRLVDAMATLPDEDHHVLVLRQFEGLTWREVGEGLGCHEDTARTRFYRAFDRLKRLM